MAKYTESDLHDLIAKVETEFNKHLAKAQEESQSLQKSEMEKCGEMSKADEETEQPKDQSEKQEDKKKPEQDHDYDEADQEELKKLYADMAPSERALHKAALEACESRDGELNKSEEKATTKEEIPVVTESEDLKLAKNEIEQLKKSNEELQVQFKELVSKMTKNLVRPAPKQKAVTELGVLEKSEKQEENTLPKTREEAIKILNTKIIEGGLKKSDRDAIKAYTLGEAKLETVSHLLK